MKKFITIVSIIILCLLVLILVLPFAFQGKILKLAKDQINSSLNAKADFDKLSLSFMRYFPNASVGLKKLYVAGINEFEGDTLFSAREIKVVVDVISAIKMENIKVKRIFIDKPRVYAHVLADGKANWDIMKEMGTGEEDTSSGEFNTKVELKSFEISDAVIRYEDEKGKILTSLQDMDFVMTGDMAQDFSTLSIT